MSSAVKRPLSQSEPPPNPIARTSAQRLVLVVLSRVLRALGKLTGQLPNPADSTTPKYAAVRTVHVGVACAAFAFDTNACRLQTVF
jgi:hypothetical protein